MILGGPANIVKDRSLKAVLFFALIGTGLGGCAEFMDPNYGSQYPSSGPGYGNSGYGNSGYGNNRNNDPYYHDHGSYDDNRYHDYERDRRRAERERERMEEERERLEQERERQHDEDQRRRFDDLRLQQQHQQPAPPPPREGCPSGFHETDRKCSDDERRHGCKDIKTSSGVRCINR